MPFIPNDQSEEAQKDPNAQGAVAPAGGGAVHLAPSSGVGGAGPAGSAGTAAGGAGGSFATLDKYLAANQGQAEPLAGKITGQIGEQYKGLDQANQGVLQNISGQVSSAPGYTAGNADLLAQEAANPVSFASDANNVSAFQKQATNSYGGPTSAEGDAGYQKQQADVNSAISQGNANTTTEAGRQNLLSQNEATPTTGVTALNSAILSQDPNSLSKVQDAYKPFQNLVTNLGSGAADINKTIGKEQADAASSSAAAQGQVTGQMTGMNTAIANQLAAAKAAGTAQNTAVNSALKSGTADAGTLASLGMTQDQWNTLTAAQKAAATSTAVSSNQGQFGANTGTANIDLAGGLTQKDPNAVYNAGNVATADQYAQVGAFNNLINGLNLQTPQMSIDAANAKQAGTAPTNLNTYDYAGTLKNAQDTTTAEKSAAQAYVDALQAGADENHAQLAAQNAQKNETIANVGGAAANTAGMGLPSVAAGVGQAKLGQIQQAISNPSLKTAANLFNPVPVVGGAIKGAESAVKSVVNTVSNVFSGWCFHPDTQIEMANGGTKSICKIQIGDETKGGMVSATMRGMTTEFYWYGGVLVTGKHAVKEDGVWVRVENSKNGRQFKYLTEVVCSLVTEKHRIWANGIEFADFYETDQYESLDMDESLAELNKQEEKQSC